jgi:hypothetical protein
VGGEWTGNKSRGRYIDVLKQRLMSGTERICRKEIPA